jgi:hypothetical protein
MPLSLIALHYESTAPVSRPNCRERRGPPPTSRSVIVPFMRSEI